MAIYDTYASRDRVRVGVSLKRYLARQMFTRTAAHSAGGLRSVLEIGPGDGYIAQLCRETNVGYQAIERSESVAKGMIADGFAVSIGAVPPLPDGLGVFDACFLLHVIEHMNGPAEATGLIDGIKNQLGLGGLLTIATPDFSNWGHHFYDCDYTHSLPFTRRNLVQLLVDHDMEVLQSTVYTGPIFGYRSLPISWLAKMLYPQFADDMVGRFAPKDILNRGLLTFLPCLFVVAKKVSG